MQCKTCKFFDEVNNFGYCRRYAPRHLSGVGTGFEENKWPEVQPDDWCGEYQFADEKLHIGVGNLTLSAVRCHE